MYMCFLNIVLYCTNKLYHEFSNVSILHISTNKNVFIGILQCFIPCYMLLYRCAYYFHNI